MAFRTLFQEIGKLCHMYYGTVYNFVMCAISRRCRRWLSKTLDFSFPDHCLNNLIFLYFIFLLYNGKYSPIKWKCKHLLENLCFSKPLCYVNTGLNIWTYMSNQILYFRINPWQIFWEQGSWGAGRGVSGMWAAIKDQQKVYKPTRKWVCRRNPMYKKGSFVELDMNLS